MPKTVVPKARAKWPEAKTPLLGTRPFRGNLFYKIVS